jgi:hypothetical protein
VTAAETGGPAHGGRQPGSAQPASPGTDGAKAEGTTADCPEAEGAIVRGGEPLFPEQSREDTDAAWGEYPESADDRLYRDRPPHWDDV